MMIDPGAWNENVLDEQILASDLLLECISRGQRCNDTECVLVITRILIDDSTKTVGRLTIVIENGRSMQQYRT